ncbi:MAG: nucleotidyltransferase domain-containing protein [Candidatus Caldarchaeales archaeon]
MDRYLDVLARRAAMVREWRRHVAEIASAARSVLPDARVYVFGSAVRGEAVGGSDVDVLVVSRRVPSSAIERGRLRAMIEDAAGLPDFHPFEIHVVDEGEAGWYFARAKEMVPVDVEDEGSGGA